MNLLTRLAVRLALRDLEQKLRRTPGPYVMARPFAADGCSELPW